MSRRNPRRAGPRTLEAAGVTVERHPRFKATIKLSRFWPRADVTALVVDGIWSHGQRQRVRVLLPTDTILALVTDLVGAMSSEVEKIAGPEPVPARPGDGPAGERTAGTTPQPPSSAPPVRTDTALAALLAQRADRYFDGRPAAKAAWLRPHLNRHHVETLEELPTPVLAGLFNGLASAPNQPT